MLQYSVANASMEKCKLAPETCYRYMKNSKENKSEKNSKTDKSDKENKSDKSMPHFYFIKMEGATAGYSSLGKVNKTSSKSPI